MVIVFSLSGGHVVGNFCPHEAFVIGGTNSVRGYEEGAVGSGRSYAVGCGEISFPLVCKGSCIWVALCFMLHICFGLSIEFIIKDSFDT